MATDFMEPSASWARSYPEFVVIGEEKLRVKGASYSDGSIAYFTLFDSEGNHRYDCEDSERDPGELRSLDENEIRELVSEDGGLIPATRRKRKPSALVEILASAVPVDGGDPVDLNAEEASNWNRIYPDSVTIDGRVFEVTVEPPLHNPSAFGWFKLLDSAGRTYFRGDWIPWELTAEDIRRAVRERRGPRESRFSKAAGSARPGDQPYPEFVRYAGDRYRVRGELDEGGRVTFLELLDAQGEVALEIEVDRFVEQPVTEKYIRSVAHYYAGLDGYVTLSGGEPIEQSTEAELQQELAVIVAYTQDEYIRKHGNEHGVAQEVARAILAAGFVKDNGH